MLLVLLFVFFFEIVGDAIRESEFLLPPLNESLTPMDLVEELNDGGFSRDVLFGLREILGDGTANSRCSLFSVSLSLSSFPSCPPLCDDELKLEMVWVVSWDT